MLGKGGLYKHFPVICYPTMRRINMGIYPISTGRVPQSIVFQKVMLDLCENKAELLGAKTVSNVLVSSGFSGLSAWQSVLKLSHMNP